MSPETHDPQLDALARSLSQLAPSAGRLDRDQLLFGAGRASAKRQSRFWRTSAVLMACLAAAVGLRPYLEPAPQRVQCIVYQRVEPPASSAESVVLSQPSTQDGTSPF